MFWHDTDQVSTNFCNFFIMAPYGKNGVNQHGKSSVIFQSDLFIYLFVSQLVAV